MVSTFILFSVMNTDLSLISLVSRSRTASPKRNEFCHQSDIIINQHQSDIIIPRQSDIIIPQQSGITQRMSHNKEQLAVLAAFCEQLYQRDDVGLVVHERDGPKNDLDINPYPWQIIINPVHAKWSDHQQKHH